MAENIEGQVSRAVATSTCRSRARLCPLRHRRCWPLQKQQRFLHTYPTIVPLIVLVLSLIGFAFAGTKFFSPYNMSLIVQQVSIIGVLARLSLVILTAGIDLSVAAIMVLGSVVAGHSRSSSAFRSFPLAPASRLRLGTRRLERFPRRRASSCRRSSPHSAPGTSSTRSISDLSGAAVDPRHRRSTRRRRALKFFGENIKIFGTSISYGSIFFLIVFLVLWYAA